MTNNLLHLSAIALIAACTCQAQPKQPPLACNLKAFQSDERKQWRELLDQVTSSVTMARELSNGYALQIDTTRTPLTHVAEWVALERKCCPFFEFQIDVHGEDGATWISLTGRDGVKEFIAMDFTSLQDKLAKARHAK